MTWSREMDPKYYFLGLILAGTLFEIAGDFFFKKWSMENKTMILVLGLGLYFIGTIFWAFSLKFGELSRAISIFTVLNLIGVILMGFFLFQEDVSSIQKMGMGFGILSVILMEFF